MDLFSLLVLCTSLLSIAFSCLSIFLKYRGMRVQISKAKMQEAESVLQAFYSENGITDPKLAVIMNAVGVIRHTVDPRLDVYAKLIPATEDGKYIILCKNPSSSDSLRFSIAHECGHLINKDDVSVHNARLPRKRKTLHDRYIDYIAAAILLPKAAIVQALKDCDFANLETQKKQQLVEALAAKYKVDTVTVMRRIREVQILSTD